MASSSSLSSFTRTTVAPPAFEPSHAPPPSPSFPLRCCSNGFPLMMMVFSLSLSLASTIRALISLLSTVDDDDEVKALLTTTTTKPLQTTTTTTTSAPKRKEKRCRWWWWWWWWWCSQKSTLSLSLSLSFRKWTTKALSTTLNFCVLSQKRSKCAFAVLSLESFFFFDNF